MSRDRIVSVRLTEAEYSALSRCGRPSDVLRRALASPPQTVIHRSTTCPSLPLFIAWTDGTFGATYPALMTG